MAGYIVLISCSHQITNAGYSSGRSGAMEWYARTAVMRYCRNARGPRRSLTQLRVVRSGPQAGNKMWTYKYQRSYTPQNRRLTALLPLDGQPSKQPSRNYPHKLLVLRADSRPHNSQESRQGNSHTKSRTLTPTRP